MLLQAITDRRLLARPELLPEHVRALAVAGVDWIQLREKDLPVRELERLAGACVAALAGTEAKLLVNGRVDVAIAVSAHGVHLPANELRADEARAIFAKAGRSDALVGVSCHSVEEVAMAESCGADYALFAPVFEKVVAEGECLPGRGLAALRAACHRPRAASSAIPVLALGGITEANAADCVQAGATGVAAIRLFHADDDLPALVQRLHAISGAKEQRPPRHAYQPR